MGFRATARSIAQRHAVSGWVRNQPDDSVHLEAQGEAASINAYLADLERVMSRNIDSAPRSTIDDVEGERGFHIR